MSSQCFNTVDWTTHRKTGLQKPALQTPEAHLEDPA